MYRRGCIAFHHSTRSPRSLRIRFGRSRHRMTNARPPSSYQGETRRFPSKSSTGCAPLEHSLGFFIDLNSEREGISSGATRTRNSNHCHRRSQMFCGRIEHLSNSHPSSNKFDLSGMPYAAGPVNIQMGVFKGRDVALKSLGVSKMDDKIKTGRLETKPQLPVQARLLTHRTALLQRVCHVEDLVASQRSQYH